MSIVLLFFLSFLIGSIPTGFWLGKVLKGIDIRKFGSGNVGATNVLRVLGKPWGIIVLLFDIFKGIFSVVYLPLLFNQSYVSGEILRIALGITAIAGHNWSLFLGFKGGKGVATSLGVLIGLAIALSQLRLVLLFSIAIWLSIFLISGFVSLASIICALFLPLLVFIYAKSQALIIFSLFVAIFGLLRHKSNICRLLEKKENRVKFPWLAR